MLRNLLTGALRSRTTAGRSAGYGGRRGGGGDVGGAVGAQVGRTLLGRLTRRR